VNRSLKLAVSRGAQLAAAIADGDLPRIPELIAEARNDGATGLEDLAYALAVRVVGIAREFYDTDCQRILDEYAISAMTAAAGETDLR
jgi:hypothetical protein